MAYLSLVTYMLIGLTIFWYASGNGSVLDSKLNSISVSSSSRSSRYCCETGRSNVTTLHSYVNSILKSSIATKSIVSTIRLACPGPAWPTRPNVEDCYYYRSVTFTKYIMVTTLMYRNETVEYDCKPGSSYVCCPQYTEYKDSCLTDAQVEFENFILQFLGKPLIGDNAN